VVAKEHLVADTGVVGRITQRHATLTGLDEIEHLHQNCGLQRKACRARHPQTECRDMLAWLHYLGGGGLTHQHVKTKRTRVPDLCEVSVNTKKTS
jgi:hypothetical protein